MGEGTAKPVHVGEGLYEYTTTAGLVRYKASIKHHDKYYRKCGFSTIKKAKNGVKAASGRLPMDGCIPNKNKKGSTRKLNPRS
jgi:hypothetical protein